jgi:hypothetical protein
MLGADILHPLRCQSSEALAEAGRNACGRSDIGDSRFRARPELGQELPCRAGSAPWVENHLARVPDSERRLLIILAAGSHRQPGEPSAWAQSIESLTIWAECR